MEVHGSHMYQDMAMGLNAHSPSIRKPGCIAPIAKAGFLGLLRGRCINSGI